MGMAIYGIRMGWSNKVDMSTSMQIEQDFSMARRQCKNKRKKFFLFRIVVSVARAFSFSQTTFSNERVTFTYFLQSRYQKIESLICCVLKEDFFDRELALSARGPTSGTYSCDFVNLLDFNDAIPSN